MAVNRHMAELTNETAAMALADLEERVAQAARDHRDLGFDEVAAVIDAAGVVLSDALRRARVDVDSRRRACAVAAAIVDLGTVACGDAGFIGLRHARDQV